MCLLCIVGRPGVSWGVLGCPGVIRLTAFLLVKRFISRIMTSILIFVHKFMVISVQTHLGLGLFGPNRYFTGAPRSGTPRSIKKNVLFVGYNGKQKPATFWKIK